MLKQKVTEDGTLILSEKLQHIPQMSFPRYLCPQVIFTLFAQLHKDVRGKFKSVSEQSEILSCRNKRKCVNFCGMLMSSFIPVTSKTPQIHFSSWLLFIFPLLPLHHPPYLKMKVNIKCHINSCLINHDFLWVMLQRATCFIRNQRKNSAKSGWANVKSLTRALRRRKLV